MMRCLAVLLCLLLAACAPAPDRGVTTRAAVAESSLPPMKTFSAVRPAPPRLSNADLARDFLDLSFRLESGQDLAVFTRFEGPVTVRLVGTPQPTVPGDLARLLHRLRREAGIDISQTTSPDANITINVVRRSDIRRYLPQAACFVVPNVGTLADYRGARGTARTSWERLTARHRLAIFLPGDVSPQEARDCMHEELAQALGPLNDLYRLPGSVFNDDNMHAVLTGYDMLILRAYYDPALHNGMTRAEVAARLPSILARINPEGVALAGTNAPPTPREWIDAIQVALGPGASYARRRAAAADALRIAIAARWTDHRRGFSHYAYGRILQGANAEAARAQFLLADRYFSTNPLTRIHRAFVASQLAAYAIHDNRPEEALLLVAAHLDVAASHQNAALLATLMMLRAEALEIEGRVTEADNVRLDSLGWARYGFGSDWSVRAKLREISGLKPLQPIGGKS